MTKKQIMDAIGRADDDLIAQTDALRRKKRRPVWIKWGAAAACLCLIAAGAFGLLRGKPANTVQHWRAGYTGADYFRFCDAESEGGAASEAKLAADAMPWAETRSFSDSRSELEANGVIPVIDTHPLFTLDARYRSAGSLYCAELTWSRRNAKGLKDYSDLKVIAAPEEVQLIDDCISIELDANGNILEPAVTVTERDGVQIVARGRADTEKTLTWQTELGWYQISGSWNDDYASVAKLLDWFWTHPLDLTQFPLEAGDEYSTASRSEVPEAFAGYLPDFTAFGFLEESTVVVMKNGIPVRFEGHYVAHVDAEAIESQTFYEAEGCTTMHWCIFSEWDAYDPEGCLGELGALTREQIVNVLTNEDNKVKFMQDGLLVIVYPDDADEAWTLIESLQ